MALRPIIVDANGMILGGNMRYKALLHLGYKEVPDEWVKRADDLTEEERRRFIISDNVGFGDWDWQGVANEWDVEELADWGLDVPDFEVKEGKDQDLSDKIKSSFIIEVICNDEQEQQMTYNRLIELGFQCRVLTF